MTDNLKKNYGLETLNSARTIPMIKYKKLVYMTSISWYSVHAKEPMDFFNQAMGALELAVLFENENSIHTKAAFQVAFNLYDDLGNEWMSKYIQKKIDKNSC